MDNKLQKRYGLFTAICMVVGIVIGSGVFFKATSVLTNNNGNMAMSLLTVLAVGAVMLVCAYVFSMLAKKVSHVNGVVDYAEMTCGKTFGYFVGWFMTTIYYPCIAATLSWVSANYTCILLGIADKGNLRFALAALFMVLSCFLNAISPKLAGKFQVSTTVIKLVPLAIMAVIGTVVGLFSGQTFDTFAQGSLPVSVGGKGFFGAVSAFAFALEGWIIATSINAEIKDSKKNLPRALIIGMSCVVGIYLVYFIGVGSVLSPEEIILAGDALPKVAFTELFGGNRVFGSIAYAFIIVSCLGTLNGVMLGCCRGMYSIAERDQGPAPKVFSQVDPITNMPTNSAVFGLALAMLWLAQWEFGLIEQALPAWLNFENDELPIITLYLSYIPVFIMLMIKGKELKKVERFVITPVAILGCVFMVYAAISAYKIQALHYIIVFAIFMLIGALFYRRNGASLADCIRAKLCRSEKEE